MRLILSSIVPLALVAVTTAPAQPVPRVGVLELTGENLPAGDLRALTDRLRMEIHATGRYVVLERERMDAILQEQGFQQTGCTVSECAIEIGQLLGVEKMVAGSINRIDAITTINVRLLDVATGAIERTALKDCRCPLSEVLTSVLRELAEKLAGTSRSTPALLTLRGLPSDARVRIDGRRADWRPTRPLSVAAGLHRVRAARQGFHEATADVDLDPGATATVALSMQPKSRAAAFLRSLFLPGWGQAYSGRPGASALFILAEVGAAGGLGYAAYLNRGARDDYDAAKADYLGARGVDQPTLDVLRADMLDRRDEVDRTFTYSLGAAGVFLGLRALDAIDAAARFPDLGRVRMVRFEGGASGFLVVIPIEEGRR